MSDGNASGRIGAGKDLDGKKPFLRQWGVLIAFAAVGIAAIGGFRMWTEHQADQPIVEPYKAYVAGLAAASPRAADFLKRYQAVYGRDTVMSKHYLQMCAVMTRVAAEEGAHPEKIHAGQAGTCSAMAQMMVEPLELP